MLCTSFLYTHMENDQIFPVQNILVGLIQEGGSCLVVNNPHQLIFNREAQISGLNFKYYISDLCSSCLADCLPMSFILG